MAENFGVENPLEKVEEEMKELEEREKKYEKDEHERSKFNNLIAITVSIYAVLTAIAGLKESQITTDTLLEMDNAVLYQSQASDQWAYYQAKGIKGELYNSQAKTLSVINPQAKDLQNEFQFNAKSYDKEKQEIEAKGHELEKQREEKLKETTSLVLKHHKAGMALVFLQVSIVLASISSLLKKSPLWYGSMAVAAIGLFFLVPLLLT
jgi:hypothetical protein